MLLSSTGDSFWVRDGVRSCVFFHSDNWDSIWYRPMQALCSGISENCGAFGLPHRECFWDPVRCGHFGSQVESVSRYWELPQGNRAGLGGDGAKRVHGREESWCVMKSVETLGSGCIERWEATAYGLLQSGDKTWGLDLEDGKENEGCLSDFLAGVDTRLPGMPVDLTILYLVWYICNGKFSVYLLNKMNTHTWVFRQRLCFVVLEILDFCSPG